MAQLMGPSFLTLLVRDLEVSRHFYAELLGLPISPERYPHAMAFETKPIPFAIRISPVDLDTVPQLDQGVIVWFRADDAAGLYQQLKEQGVPITQELAAGPFGKTFTFRDPDGHPITVHDGG